MKCPYQKKVIHRPEVLLHNPEALEEIITTIYAEDITVFCECLKSECPFYYTTEYKPARKIKEHCRRAESEK